MLSRNMLDRLIAERVQELTAPEWEGVAALDRLLSDPMVQRKALDEAKRRLGSAGIPVRFVP